ncbi:MAG: hypothetical protein K0Q68_793 [Moraxellaceae bacterium]|jgi:hypothetical protein|nr:hypothetical protein [Moraxellaceae bacterium]
MKALPLLLAAGSLAIGTAQARTVVLTPDEVVNGIQINAAIDTATQYGTEPGKVVFDGQSKGFSCFIGEDNPENSKLTFIQYSNLQLVGINGANTGDGICNVVFADASLENILIEGLKIASFIEEGTGISAPGLSVRKYVTIRNNDITGAIALQAFNAVDWKIYNNTMGRSRDIVVSLVGAQDSEVIGNTINGFPGLLMSSSQTQETTGNRIVANRFSDSQGITLRAGATRNIVALNTGECPVVILDPGTTQNKVLFNWAPRASCGEYGAVQDLGSGNKVSGNRP